MALSSSKGAKKPVVLIVDDDRNTREGLQRALKYDYQVRLAADARMAEMELEDGLVDVMLTDMRMPGMNGLELLKHVRSAYPRVACVLLTAYGSIETAVAAMKEGASDFLTKPINLDQLDIVIGRVLKARDQDAKIQELGKQLDKKYGMDGIIGNSDAMQPVFDIIRDAAPTLANVLITGPSGSGKELVAHAIHRLSNRSKGPFVAVNCAALSPSLLESELFGHEKGAFTGADSRAQGRFERANGGTLFLDEIGEIDLSTQVKLLRVLEARKFERVGGTEPIDVDIRLVAATNRNLREMIEKGTFREDLFYRLAVVDIQLPPLADRAEDIPVMCDTFIKEFAERNGKTGVKGITAEAVNLLSAYSWPGNVRELRNTIERMVVLAHGEKLTARDIPQQIRDAIGKEPGATARAVVAAIPRDGSLESTERGKILATLEKHKGNKTRAALELGISRRTLHRKLKEYREEGILPGDSSAE